MSKIKSGLKFLASYAKSKIYPPELSMGTIFVTRRCNKKCGYCESREDQNPKEELSLKEVQEAIDKLREYGVWFLGFSGGEPTLRRDLSDIIKHANSNGMFTIVYTNGSFSNVSVDDVVSADVDTVDIALDSISNTRFKNYDEVRGVLERLVHQYDVGVKLNFCVFRENYHEVDNVLGLTRHYKIPLSIHLGEFSPLPTSVSYDPTLLFKRGNKEDIRQVREISKLLAQRARETNLIINPPEYFEAWPRYMEGRLEWKCKAGETSLCVDCDGKVLPCVNAVSPIKINGQDTSYKDINKGNIDLIKQRVQELTQQCTPRCLSCTYMLEYYSMGDPLRVLRVVLSF